MAQTISEKIKERIQFRKAQIETSVQQIEEKIAEIQKNIDLHKATENPTGLEDLQKDLDHYQSELETVKLASPNFFANDNISEFIEGDEELDALVDEVTEKYQALMDSLVIDTENDHNTQDTARRVAKMFIREVYHGRYQPQPNITDFPNHKDLDEIYTLGPIEVKSACSHHMVPIIGQAWIGIKPTDRVIGISKFHRLVKWVMARPHIQEEAVQILADIIEKLVKPEGVAVVIKATHMCMTWRGVEAQMNSTMVTSVVRGSMRENNSQKQEFFNIIEAQGFKR